MKYCIIHITHLLLTPWTLNLHTNWSPSSAEPRQWACTSCSPWQHRSLLDINPHGWEGLYAMMLHGPRNEDIIFNAIDHQRSVLLMNTITLINRLSPENNFEGDPGSHLARYIVALQLARVLPPNSRSSCMVVVLSCSARGGEKKLKQ